MSTARSQIKISYGIVGGAIFGGVFGAVVGLAVGAMCFYAALSCWFFLVPIGGILSGTIGGIIGGIAGTILGGVAGTIVGGGMVGVIWDISNGSSCLGKGLSPVNCGSGLVGHFATDWSGPIIVDTADSIFRYVFPGAINDIIFSDIFAAIVGGAFAITLGYHLFGFVTRL